MGQGSEEGFTLLESIITLVILSLALASILPSLRQVAGFAERATSLEAERRLSDNLLQQIGTAIPCREGHESGKQDGLSWAISAKPFDTGGAWPLRGALYEVQISIETEGRPLMQSSTLCFSGTG